MAVINLHVRQVEEYLKAIRPVDEVLRAKMDFGYSYNKNTFELFEIRPNWLEDKESIRSPYAKFRLIKSKQIWKLYWLRASGKWLSYTPMPTALHLSDILNCIKEDAHGCFHG